MGWGEESLGQGSSNGWERMCTKAMVDRPIWVIVGQ